MCLRKKPKEEWHLENRGVLKAPIGKYSSLYPTNIYNIIPGYTHLITKVYQVGYNPFYCLILNNNTLLVEKAYPVGFNPKIEYNKKLYGFNSSYSSKIGHYIELEEFDYLNFSEKMIYSGYSDLELAKKLSKEGIEGLEYNPKHNQFYFYNRDKSSAFILDVKTNNLTKLKGITYFKLLMPLDNDLIEIESDKKVEYIDVKTLEKVKKPTIIPNSVHKGYVASEGNSCSGFCSTVSLKKNDEYLLLLKIPRTNLTLVLADTIKKRIYYWHDSISTADYNLDPYDKINLDIVDFYRLRYDYNNAASRWEKENAQRKMDSLYTKIFNTCDLKCYRENGTYLFNDESDLNRYLSYTRVLPEYSVAVAQSNFKENYAAYRKAEIEKLAQSLTWQAVDQSLKPMDFAYPNQSLALGSFLQDEGQTAYAFWDDMFYKISNSTKKIQLYQPLLKGYKQVVHLSGDNFYVANEEKIHLIDMAQGKVLKELALKNIPMGLGMRQFEIDESGSFLIITFDKDINIYFDLKNNKLIATDFEHQPISSFITTPFKRSPFYMEGYPGLSHNERPIIFPERYWNINYTGEIFDGDKDGDNKYSSLYCGIQVINAAQCDFRIAGFYRNEMGTFEVYQDFGPDLMGLWKADLYKMTFDEEKPEYCTDMSLWVIGSGKVKEEPVTVNSSNACTVCFGKAFDKTKDCSNKTCHDGIAKVTTRNVNVYSGGGVAVVYTDKVREEKCFYCKGTGNWVCGHCKGTGVEPPPRKKKKK
jgi:hypothetical protein